MRISNPSFARRAVAVVALTGMLLLPVRAAAPVEELAPVKLPAPSFDRKPAHSGKTGVRVSEITGRPNQITTDDKWFFRNKIHLREYHVEKTFGLGAEAKLGPAPPELPRKFAGLTLIRAIAAAPGYLLVYGPDYSEGRVVAHVVLEAGKPVFKFAYDFSSFMHAPGFEKDDMVLQSLQWAAMKGDLLYVSHFHRTYSDASRGMNGYVTAVDLKTQTVKWRSAPLVCNANNFELIADAVVCGYGFTNEPDSLYVLDALSGGIAQSVTVKSAPSYLVAETEDRMLVRCYDTDYAFKVGY